MDWKKALLLAGGAAGACAVLYYLLEADADSSAHIVVDRQVIDPKKDTKVDGISKEQVQQILQEIIQSQAIMKLYMKNFTKELLSTKLSFEEAYKRVKEVQPSDPLEKHGLSMMDFDQLLDKHQNDPSVSAALSDIVGAPVPSSSYNKSITVKEILSIHHFMLEELEKLVSYIEGMQDRSSYDMKTMTITAQAIVGSKVEKRFQITSEEIEMAVLMHNKELQVDQDFNTVNVKIQQTMGRLMGATFPA